MLGEEALERLGVVGRRALVFFFHEDAGSEKVLEQLVARAEKLQDCEVIAIRPVAGAAAESEAAYPPVRFVADAPVKNTTFRRDFGVPSFTGMRGEVTARVTYALDRAGMVRGVCAEEEDTEAHVDFAVGALRGMTAAPVSKEEAAVLERVETTADGQTVLKRRPSAVGRMREQERLAKERRARGEASAVDMSQTSPTNTPALIIFLALVIVPVFLYFGDFGSF